MQPLPCILQRIAHFVHPLSRTRVFIDTPEHPQELEGNRVVKGAQIQPRGALDFLEDKMFKEFPLGVIRDKDKEGA